MKKTRILSLLLGLSLLCTLIVPATVYADDPTADSGMKISKTATANADGTYTITLEAFATGAQTTSTVTKDIPTDIILVLDQSGSMADDIGQVQYTPYTGNNTQNKSNYEKRHNGGSANLWHKLKDGSFVSVSVTLQQTITYNKITKGRNNDDSNGYTNYWENQNNLYTYVNGEIKKVVYTRERDNRLQNWNCKYALEDGTILNQNNEGRRYSPTFQNTDDGYLYLAVADENQYVYTYTYTDSTGALQTIGTSIGANTQFISAFYQRSTSTSGGGSRLNALKNAANAFIGAVAEKAAGKDGDINTPDDNINHRIAVVGFASESEYGNNTELLSITGRNSGSVGVAYNNIKDQNLKDVLQSMDNQKGRAMVNAAINALSAEGATRTDLGMDMAQRILNANPVPQGETRNRIVIVFTDGSPTDSNGFELSVANKAISKANAIKNNKATVYSIGIFSGADASTAGEEPENDYYNDVIWGPNYTDAEMSAACNWFMQKVSSNNGTPRTPSYYLSAGDSASLNSIFQQISNNITTGGSATTLGSETVVKDIISPYFTLPAGASAKDIQINTYACTGKNGDTYTWSSTSGGNGGATATVNGDQVSVTGFDFSENWCGTETNTQGTTTVRGKKLVISFTVNPKSGFLGGNNVITNASAGIYENSSAQTPVMTFEQPKVNVPIKDVTVTATDKNVYLLGDVTADQLKNGATVKVGDVTLDLSKANDTEKPYGLEKWQMEYVNITVAVKDKDGNEISPDGLKDLTDDTIYTIKATVTPKTTSSTGSAGTPATVKTGQNNPAKINVFKPELTFKDSQIDLGDTAVYEKQNHGTNFKVWKHGETLSTGTGVTMIGTKPELTLSYTPSAAAFTQDTPVKVTVKIGETDVTEKTKFKHEGCNFEGCKWGQDGFKDCHFIVHVKSFDLTIKKTGTQPIDENQSFVFEVKKDDSSFSMDVVIQGNSSVTIKGLKPGTYTVTEETGWSWRYTPKGGESQAVNPAAENVQKDTNGAVLVTFDNDRKNDKWLNGGALRKNLWGTSPASKSN